MIINDELQKSTDLSGDKYMMLEQATASNEDLQSLLGEKQRLLNASIADLAEGRDCKFCAYIDKCSMHQIERNLAYKSCARWQWRSVKAADKTAEMPLRKQ